MPRVTNRDKLIPKIYRRSYDDHGLFFYVNGQKAIMPALTTAKAIENYYRFICEDDYDTACAMTTLTRMNREFIESQKT
jgi:hypothetical protein